MSNPFYNASGSPTTASGGYSATIRAEFASIAAGFALLPPSLTANKAVIINSFSKYFCMTGWRVGWMVLPNELVRTVERLQQNFAISVPTLSQIAAEAAFDGKAEMDEVKHGYEENRRILMEGLPKAGLDKFLPVDGAFYLYADISKFS